MFTSIIEFRKNIIKESIEDLKKHLDRDDITLVKWIVDNINLPTRLTQNLDFNNLTADQIQDIVKYVDNFKFYNKLPSMYFYADPEDVSDNTWLIHFSNSANEIYKQQKFNYGISDYLKLGMTHLHNKVKSDNVYNFAFEANDLIEKYGNLQKALNVWTPNAKSCIIFKSKAIKAYHFGDDIEQVIFYAPDAHDINLLKIENNLDKAYQNFISQYDNNN